MRGQTTVDKKRLSVCLNTQYKSSDCIFQLIHEPFAAEATLDLFNSRLGLTL